MSFHGWEFQSPLYKKRIAEARAEERVEARRMSIRTVLAARGIILSDTGSARLDACAEVEELERWLSVAANAATEDDLWGTR